MRISLALLGFYKRWISPILRHYFGVRCRFEPSCSNYAATAVQQFGWLGGIWLAITRLLRCHPWGKTGYDPVPQRFKLLGSRVIDLPLDSTAQSATAPLAQTGEQHVHCEHCQQQDPKA